MGARVLWPQANLHNLRVGESGRVSALTAVGVQRRRLLDLGFVPGAVIKNERKSPFGDPIAFQVRGAIVALRKEEAALIQIVKLI
jgi:ferrous iron transport protein A